MTRSPDPVSSEGRLWTVEEALGRAEARTGLGDFGGDSFREGFERLRDSLAQAPVTRPGVWDLVNAVWLESLENRLRVAGYVADNPAVKEEQIVAPTFVIGLPRTGTTLTSYLLDQDPRRRSLLLWEALCSAPPASGETLRSDPRCRELLARQEEELRRDPSWRNHHEFADGPTECITLHRQEFKSFNNEYHVPAPDYSRWLLHADLTSAYEYEKTVLQILQSAGARGDWTLKMPSHACHIVSLLEVFPDARFVWVHRDPYRALGSLFDSKLHHWTTYGGWAPLEYLRGHYLDYERAHVERPMRVRERLGDVRFHDVYYADLVREPLGEMRSLYAWLGVDLTPEVERSMAAWLERNPQGRFGTHEYSLAKFGLSQRDVEPIFAEYLEAYAPEPEGR